MLILIVDDADDMRETTRILLELEGHTVISAENGATGVAAAEKRCPDVILMDFAMPVMDGLTATRTLRQLPGTRSVPIVAMSAYGAIKEWRDRALAAGMDECLQKPCELDALVAVLSRFAGHCGPPP